MRWTTQEKRVEEYFAPSVKKRVELRMTRFRRGVDDAGTAWIVADKHRIASFDYSQSTIAELSVARDLQQLSNANDIDGSERHGQFLAALEEAGD